jgi:hypothetical protein
MKRPSLVVLITVLALAALVAWVASNTSWEDTKVPMPLKGEARTNPFYVVQRFAEALGARTSAGHVLTLPGTDAVVVLSGWHWDLSSERRLSLEQWVESGGRLVVDDSFIGGEYEFELWSGIVRDYRYDEQDDADVVGEECRSLAEEHDGARSDLPGSGHRQLCDFYYGSFLSTSKVPRWALRDASGMQAARVTVGRGSVTVINSTPFREQDLFEGDHGWVFVAATELRKGDHVVFLSEDDHPSLVALAWQHGAPVVVLTLALVALALWRAGVRFGPLLAEADVARRSLAEQIRGTGQFALRHGGTSALHAACVRALDEAARRRISGYAGLESEQRAGVLARLTGVDPQALGAALHGGQRSPDLRTSMALLESVRRHLLIERRK